MKIFLCQINPIIGDIKGNKKKILEGYTKGIAANADLVIFPELALCGYPPQDLLVKSEFRVAVKVAANEIAAQTNNIGLLFGSIDELKENVGTGLYNSAILCYNGEVKFIQHKTLLPNYDVFDEVRYFESAKEVEVHEFNGEKLGISICEDIWNDTDYWKHRRYSSDPVQCMLDEGASILINISASPYAYGRRDERKEMLSVLTRTNKIPLAYVCCTGAQTDLIFDGGSLCFNSLGELVRLGKTYEEDFFMYDTSIDYKPIKHVEGTFEEEILNALVLGLKDYAQKSGFSKALIGLSGGIDSAIVTYIAVQALGNENVTVVMMPSQYSSEGSIKDSEKLIKKLNINYHTIEVESVFNKTIEILTPIFKNTQENIAEENLQARIRGIYLMALSNKFNYLLCTTGNKSEIAVGYATLYGDMCGAVSVIGDIYKTEVYKLAKYINRNSEIIPVEIIKKAPSAELKPNQKDEDSLPPYSILDKILRCYLEDYLELNEIVKIVGDEELVKNILSMVDRNEFKRKQSAPILRVSVKAFGNGRRFPIVQKWQRNLN